MAIYHLSVSNVSRAKGGSSVASVSYITSERMRDELWDKTYYGFGRRERVVGWGVELPEGAPAEYASPERLFNAVEAVETAGDARTAKKIVVALPVELTAGQRLEAVRGFVAREITARGYAACWAIHDEDGANPHAHVIVANRQIDPKTGHWAKVKRRSEYVLDENGERVPQIDPKTGQQKLGKRNERLWKRRTVKANPIDERETLQSMREAWAETCNRLLPEGAQIDHRSHEARGIDAEPTIHEGYAAREIERRGGVSEKCEANRQIRQRNGMREWLRDRIHALGGDLDRLDRLIETLQAKLQAAKTAVTDTIASQWEALIGRINTGTDAPAAPTGGGPDRDAAPAERQPAGADHGAEGERIEDLLAKSAALRGTASEQRGAASRDGRAADSAEKTARAERIEREARERAQTEPTGPSLDDLGWTNPGQGRIRHRGR